MYTGLQEKYPLFLSDFNETCIYLNFLDEFSKNTRIKFNENLSRESWGVAWGRADRQSDRQDETNSRVSQFCEGAQQPSITSYIQRRQKISTNTL